jgi:Tat protein secretion system quality control protein TatD with DNase activity
LFFLGVQKIIVHGSNIKNCKEALRLTRIYPGIIYSSAGLHPMDSKNVIDDPNSWSDFEDISKQIGMFIIRTKWNFIFSLIILFCRVRCDWAMWIGFS